MSWLRLKLRGTDPEQLTLYFILDDLCESPGGAYG